MRFSYNKLWKLLTDKGWTKTKLRQEAGISSSTIAKLGKGENITTDILLEICIALD
ncbi:TPA: helix-turn-helix domain-containing protein, partial [Streptococcus pyogenes]